MKLHIKVIAFYVVLCLPWMVQFATAQQGISSEQAQSGEQRELWSGTAYTSRFRMGICLGPAQAVRGVFLLKQRSGAVDVYHIQGRVENNIVYATHHSGHVFVWHLVDNSTVKGSVTLNDGRTISLRGERVHNARLSKDTCRPPEDTW